MLTATIAPNINEMTPREVISEIMALGLQPVFWAPVGDQKGPTEPGWPQRKYTLDDYRDGYRVGILTGTEVRPGEYGADVDFDWAPGIEIAKALLSVTGFIYGRPSKPLSHCFYTTPKKVASKQYKDPVDSTMLIELRGTTDDGSIGFQSMAPPSVWSKDGRTEKLVFRVFGPPILNPELEREVCLSAIGLLLAKYLGHNGFGHEVRLAWAGFLMRAGVPEGALQKMGVGISRVCNNLEVDDVARVIDSTRINLEKDGKKVKGGPALAKLLGEHGKKIVNQINQWLDRGQDFERRNGVIVKDSQANIRRAVALCGIELSHDLFADRMLIRQDGNSAALLDDAPVDELWLRIDREYRFRPTFGFFEKVIQSFARENGFHPVRDYLNQLRWDGVPRIDSWLLTYAGAVVGGTTDPEQRENLRYIQTVSALPLLAAVKRVYEPGAKYDEMLVLESPQGFGKSSAIQALCPRQEWFSDDLPLNVGSKELIERTLGKWIIEASDLAGKRKAEIEQLKATMSRRVDGPARMAYARKPVERPRHFILIGTTNNSEYLNDATGARRFWPVRITHFDNDALIRDRDQLWAEARVRVMAGESIRMPQELWPVASRHQEARQEVDPWEPLIHARLDEAEVRGDGRRYITTDEIYGALNIEPNRRDLASGRRISQIMQRLGFERKSVYDREARKTVPGYLEVEPSTLDDGTLAVESPRADKREEVRREVREDSDMF